MSTQNRSSIQIILVLLAVTIISSCKTENLFTNPGSSLSDGSFSQKNGYEYKIRKDDKINLSFWDHDELSVGSLYGIYNSNEVYGKWMLVNAKGEINVPKFGAFGIRGMTVVQAQDSLQKLFSVWVKNPVIELKVLNKEITMLGEFKSPGTINIDKDNYTLVEMIGKAGDFDFYANRKRIKIIRTLNNQVKETEVDLTKMEDYKASNIWLMPGDVVYAPSRKGKVFDKRAGTVVPFISIITALVIAYKAFF